MHRYTPPSLICGLVTFMWLTVVPSDMVYWLVRCPLSRGMGSSSSAQVTVGGGAPLAAHIRENCSPGLTTFSLKEETMRGVPSGGTQGEGGQGAAATAAAVTHRQDGFELPPRVGALVGTTCRAVPAHQQGGAARGCAGGQGHWLKGAPGLAEPIPCPSIQPSGWGRGHPTKGSASAQGLGTGESPLTWVLPCPAVLLAKGVCSPGSRRGAL